MTFRFWAFAILAGWLAYLVADFWTHAVLLSSWWRATEAHWLPPPELFRRIPYAYVSFGIYTTGALWLTVRLFGPQPSLGRAVGFAAALGLVVGGAGSLANYSVFSVPWSSLLVWPASMAVASAAAVFAAVLVLRSKHPGRRLLGVGAAAIGAVAIAVLLQNTFFPTPAWDDGARTQSAASVETGFLDRSVLVDGVEYRYQVYVPRDYGEQHAWPVILALHGYGERGRDGLLQTEVGLAGAIRRHPHRFPAVVVFPQTPDIWQGLGARIALAALDRSLDEFQVDPSRIYLTGMSAGGNGSWYLAYHHPERFAALVVVCGWVRERRNGLFPSIPAETAAGPFADVAERVHGVPVWIFHGEVDDIVSVEEARGMAAALKARGADVRYTELPGVNHEAWVPAYADDELPGWLFRQRMEPAE